MNGNSYTPEEKFSALIVDDEQQSLINLTILLSRYCPEIDVVGQCDSANSARKLIISKRPDILFLDIRMPEESGFDLLDSLPGQDYALVFVTAYEQYAIRAIKAGATDYVLKPVSIRELQEAVRRAIKALRDIRDNHQKSNGGIVDDDLSGKILSCSHIGLPTNEGVFIQEIRKIIRLEASGSYTVVVRDGENNLLLSKPIKEFESLLCNNSFARIHHSHIVNIEYLRKYDRKDGGYAVMKDNSRIPVSRRRSAFFLEWLHQRVPRI